jgi:hypothetical protein
MKTLTFKLQSLILILIISVNSTSMAQVGIGTLAPDASAMLEISSTTKGFLPPRMDTTARDAMATPASGLLIFNTETNQLNYYNGTSWQAVVDEGASNSSDSTDASNIISTSSTSSDVEIPGMSRSPVAGSYLVFFNSEYSIVPDTEEALVSTSVTTDDLLSLRADLDNLTVNTTQAAAYDLGGKTITPGVYYYGGAVTATTSFTFDGAGDPNALFVIKTGGAFNTSAGIQVILVNGASAKNIFFVATGAIGIGADCTLYGTLLSELAVGVGAGCVLEGRMLTTAGAITFGPGNISVPSGTSVINLRSVINFVAFTTIGAITNTGISTYNGDIATGAGAITAFETAIVNGEILPAGGDVTVIKEIDGTATFSLYQNGVLIPNSSRIRTTTVNKLEVSLQGMATVANGENIDVRWNIDAGTLSVKNRILSIIKVN